VKIEILELHADSVPCKMRKTHFETACVKCEVTPVVVETRQHCVTGTAASGTLKSPSPRLAFLIFEPHRGHGRPDSAGRRNDARLAGHALLELLAQLRELHPTAPVDRYQIHHKRQATGVMEPWLSFVLRTDTGHVRQSVGPGARPVRPTETAHSRVGARELFPFAGE
jgi:hypothetical protein